MLALRSVRVHYPRHHLNRDVMAATVAWSVCRRRGSAAKKDQNRTYVREGNYVC
jgi:hypothetical protein